VINSVATAHKKSSTIAQNSNCSKNAQETAHYLQAF